MRDVRGALDHLADPAEIERGLEAVLEAHPAAVPALDHMLRYSLLGGGKRVRPRLLLLVADLLGASSAAAGQAFQLALILEIIHGYSLVHDDLPCMDDDDYRRGRLSVHARFGYAEAVLAGDALLNLAAECAFTLCLDAHEDERGRVIEAARTIFSAAGAAGMIGGQLLDITADATPLDATPLEQLEELQRLKTGALMRAACLAPARLLAASEPVTRALGAYADALGLGFQIRDDILDATAANETLGKSSGKDARDDKRTFVTRMGLAAARSRLLDEERAAHRACDALAAIGLPAEPLRTLASRLAQRSH